MHAPRTDYGYLDSARGMSAFVVLLAHTVQIFWLRIFGEGSIVHQVSSVASHYAVVVFFLLSGFLITQSIEANIARHGRFRVTDYTCARIARIYPPFLAAVALALVVFAIMEICGLPGRNGPMQFASDAYAARTFVQLTPKELIASLLLLQGGLDVNGALWSLYIEIKLYALVACAYCLSRLTTVLPAALVAAVVLIAGLRFNPEFGRYAAIWIMGCAAFYCMAGLSRLNALKLVLALAAMLAFIAENYLFAAITGRQAPELSVPAQAVELLVAALLAFALFRLKVDVRVGRSVAPYSYSLYIVHFPVLLLFQSLLVSADASGFAALAIVSCLAPIAALLVAWRLGVVEAQKARIQKWLQTQLMRTAIGVRAVLGTKSGKV